MELEKTTGKAAARRRWYADACAAAHALDLLGERWALLVIRELMFGPKRFGDIRASLPGISANVLSQRLEGLEAIGVVRRMQLPHPANASAYDLTDWGRESEPIFQALGRWAARSPHHDPGQPFSANSLLLSLRTMFDPVRAGDAETAVGLRLGRETFVVRVAGGTLRVAAGPIDDADAIVEGAPSTVASVVYGYRSIEDCERAGAFRIAGDRELAARFASWFPMPPKL